MLRETFAGWTAKQSYARIPQKFFPNVPGGMQQIVTPDKANAVYVAGLAFPMKDSDPDYPALVMGNYRAGRRVAVVAAGRSGAAEGRAFVRRRLVHLGRRARRAHAA